MWVQSETPETGRGNHMQAQERGLNETKPADTLILYFQPPQLWENMFLFLQPPNLWYFVMAALEN
jgi:hypothetical protein